MQTGDSNLGVGRWERTEIRRVGVKVYIVHVR